MPRTKVCAKKIPAAKSNGTTALESNKKNNLNSGHRRSKRKRAILKESETITEAILSDSDVEITLTTNVSDKNTVDISKKSMPIKSIQNNKRNLANSRSKRKCSVQNGSEIYFDSLSELDDEITSNTSSPMVPFTDQSTYIVSDSEEDTRSLSDRLAFRNDNSPNIPEATTYSNSEIKINSDDDIVMESSANKPPSVIIDDFSDDSNEDLYECDFSDLKNMACIELKKTEPVKLPVIIKCLEKDSDSDLELSPLPTTRVNRPRTSRKSKMIQDALAAAREQLCAQNLNTSLDISLQDDVIIVEKKIVETVSVRVCWGTNSKRYNVSVEEPFANLYSKLAEEHKVSLSEIVLSLNGKVIAPSDSIQTTGYSIVDVIEGGTLQKSAESTPMETDKIPLKVQCSNKRDSVIINIGKFAKMEVLMNEYASLKELDVSKFIFHFDGEKLSPNETPFSLDMEGDECIDVHQIS